MRVYVLILRPTSGWVWLVDRLEEAIGRLRAEQVEHLDLDTELEGLQNSTTWGWDLVLGGPAGTMWEMSSCSSSFVFFVFLSSLV
jgi:hypothetical protein